MAKNKVQKGEILRNLKERIDKSKSIIFTGFNALGVKDNQTLRTMLKAENNEYYAAKKTLLNIALQDSKIEGLNVKDFDGQTAAVFSYEDEVSPAKIVAKFKKSQGKEKADNVFFLGGILEGRFLSSAEVTALAQVPSRHELYAKMVGSLNAPVSGFVNALAGNLRNLVGVLNAIKDKK